MPKVVKPREPVKLPPDRAVDTAGKQEDFRSAADELCRKIGFDGEPLDESPEGISVQDAFNFVVQVLHEAFIAGAKGESSSGAGKIIGHLSIEDTEDISEIETAVIAAHESGKSAQLEQHAKKVASLGDVSMTSSAAAVFDRINKGSK